MKLLLAFVVLLVAVTVVCDMNVGDSVVQHPVGGE